MFELNTLTREAIPAALEKAVRYRLLDEPEQAESICEDVLRIDPENQEALATLVLALTDRLYGPRPASPHAARELIRRFHGEYEREYYAGIVDERLVVVSLHERQRFRGGTESGDRTIDHIRITVNRCKRHTFLLDPVDLAVEDALRSEEAALGVRWAG